MPQTFIQFVVLLFGKLHFEGVSGATWSYEGTNGPSHWKDNNPICNGQSQSPINLPPLANVKYDSKLTPFQLHDFDKPSSVYNLTMKNNKHTVQVDVEGGSTLMVSGGGLIHSTYKVAQFHFHWGSDNTKGSEHTYNGIAYPMELHIVTYDSRYSSITEAADKNSGLAVLGFFFEINDDKNCNYSPLVDLMMNVAAGGTTVTLPDFKLRHLMPMMFGDYFRYDGSLTTPPCYQSVQWTVFWQKIPISSAQMDKFRQLYGDTQSFSLSNNYRPVQPLNGRSVRTNVKILETASGSGHVFQNNLIVFFMIMFPFIKSCF